jgi:conjugative relaxase-like TrwC/TraI family protein
MFAGRCRVLTIGKLGTSRGRLEYYDAQVAAGVEDYYAGRGESPGRWRGRGAAAIGLAPGGRVDRRGFMALMRGRNPLDGAVLREMGARSRVSGFDLTWSAPKSVSVLFAIEDDQVAGQLLAAHEHAVDEALAYLEREACWTRRGRDGAECVPGDGFVAASYRHRMSRAGDPQLHTHVIVANMTRADGRYTALDARWLYAHKSAAGALYRAVLRADVRERLPWVSWRPAGRGLFEVDGVPNPVLRHFSQRRIEIEERAAELVGPGAMAELSRERMQGIALATRKAKRYGVDGASWREEARARAAEHGLGVGELTRLRTRQPGALTGVDMGALARRLCGPDGLTTNHNTFAARHALAEIAGAFGQGATMAQLEDAVKWYLGGESVVALERAGQSEPRFTTQHLLACERQIIDSAWRRAGENSGILPGPLVDQVLVARSLPLNDDQAAAVRAITSSGRGVEGVTALAGTGKTTMIAAVAAAYRHAGWQVIGAAPTARAARQLREIAGVEATTMHSLLARLKRAGGFAPRTLLVLDEAATAPTRLSAELFARAERAGTKIVAIGDPGQLGPVQAGGWLAAIADEQDGPALRQVMRQRNLSEQEALQALHDGDPDPYIDHKRDNITIHETEIEALLRMVHSWHDAQRQHGRHAAVMITRDNLTRERLNRAARALLKEDGSLSRDGVVIGGREFAIGDRVIARRNDRAADVDNGSVATVVRASPDGAMVVQTDSGEPRALNPDYVAAYLEHAYVLTGHAAQGATVDWAGVVGRPTEFTREWAYTSLSRARHHTAIHLISERTDRDRERDEYAPPEPDSTAEETLQALRRAMSHSQAEPLAAEQLPRPPSRPPPAPTPLPHGPVRPSPTDWSSCDDAGLGPCGPCVCRDLRQRVLHPVGSSTEASGKYPQLSTADRAQLTPRSRSWQSTGAPRTSAPTKGSSARDG